MSKTHFYGRAAPEAILAVDLTALLPPCSGGDIFSDPVSPPRPQNAPEQEAAAERAEHTRAADLAIAAGVPARRPTRRRPLKPPTSVWMNCTRGESSTRVSSM